MEEVLTQEELDRRDAERKEQWEHDKFYVNYYGPFRPPRPSGAELRNTEDFIEAKSLKPAATILDGPASYWADSRAPSEELQTGQYVKSTLPAETKKPRRIQSVVRRAFKSKVTFPAFATRRKASAELPKAKVYSCSRPSPGVEPTTKDSRSGANKPLPPMPPMPPNRLLPPKLPLPPIPIVTKDDTSRLLRDYKQELNEFSARKYSSTNPSNLKVRGFSTPVSSVTAKVPPRKTVPTSQGAIDTIAHKPLPARPATESATKRSTFSDRMREGSVNTSSFEPTMYHRLTPTKNSLTPTNNSVTTPPSNRSTFASDHSDSSFGCETGYRRPLRSEEDTPSHAKKFEGVRQQIRKITRQVHLSKDSHE